jgi:hypothetical protein
MRLVLPVVCAALVCSALLVWRHASSYHKTRARELIGFSGPETAEPRPHEHFTAIPEDIEAVCAHVMALGARVEDCQAHYANIARLDRAPLWALRRACILEAEHLDVAYACNRANHPHWPAPAHDPS